MVRATDVVVPLNKCDDNIHWWAYCIVRGMNLEPGYQLYSCISIETLSTIANSIICRLLGGTKSFQLFNGYIWGSHGYNRLVLSSTLHKSNMNLWGGWIQAGYAIDLEARKELPRHCHFPAAQLWKDTFGTCSQISLNELALKRTLL